MAALLASVWATAWLTMAGPGCSQSPTRCDLSPFAKIGQTIAEHACARDATSETVQAVRDAAASAALACEGSTIDVTSAATATAEGFGGAQSCDCASGQSVVELSSIPPITLASEGADIGDSFDKLAESVRTFSDDHCTPGTKNGILDQSAEECSVMSQGNATELSTRLGTSFGQAWCTLYTVGGGDPAPNRDLVLLASQSLGNATARAVSETEFACSFTPSVVCALADAQVIAIARAQLDGFAGAMVEAAAAECACALDAGALTGAIAPQHLEAAVVTHAAVCESSQATFDDMADPMRDRILPGVDAALAGTACGAIAPSSSPADGGTPPRRPESVYPYAKCGSNDYSNALADGEAKQIAPAIATACCTPGYECTVKSRWYASCRPMGERPSPDWNGTVVTLEGCGV